MQDERVLVVPTSLFHRLGHFQGFCRDVGQYLDDLLDPANTRFRRRAEVEEDPGYKQLIPYVVFQHARSAGRPRVFQYTRGAGQGEARLHRLRSVGVGGHISAVDSVNTHDEQHPYENGLQRELDEEVVIQTPYRGQCVGLINDDLTPVGQVHLGVVHLFEVETPAVLPREADIVHSGFQPVDELLADLDGFESWSQICLEAMYG